MTRKQCGGAFSHPPHSVVGPASQRRADDVSALARDLAGAFFSTEY